MADKRSGKFHFHFCWNFYTLVVFKNFLLLAPMKKQKSPKSIKTRIILVAVAAILSYVLFWGEYNFLQLYQLNRQNNKLKAEILSTERERDELYEEIEKLKNDSSYIEKVAREKYMMGKKDEKIYVVKSGKEE